MFRWPVYLHGATLQMLLRGLTVRFCKSSRQYVCTVEYVSTRLWELGGVLAESMHQCGIRCLNKSKENKQAVTVLMALYSPADD